MGSRKKAIQVVQAIESATAFDTAVEESDKYLAVFDVFQNWCGPCTVMEPVLRKIKLDNDKISVKFFTVDEALLTPGQKTALPHPGACKPIFLLYKNKVLIGKVAGVNAPELETLVVDNAPEAVDEE